MILIEDRTRTTYDTDAVEVWTYDMKLCFKIENAVVKPGKVHYAIVSCTGEHIASFPSGETAFMMKTPETNRQITQTTGD